MADKLNLKTLPQQFLTTTAYRSHCRDCKSQAKSDHKLLRSCDEINRPSCMIHRNWQYIYYSQPLALIKRQISTI